MKRITPEMVLDAYQSTGLVPCFVQWKSDDGKQGCGLTAVMMSTGITMLKENMASNTVAAVMQMPTCYVGGFICGFDNDDDSFDRLSVYSERKYGVDGERHFVEGSADGKRAREAVIDYFTPKVLPELIELLVAEAASVTESVAVAS